MRTSQAEQILLAAARRANAERRRAEQGVRLAEQRQAAIIRSLSIVLYLGPVDGRPRVPRFVSGNFAAVTGYEFGALRKNPNLWIERVHEEDRERVLAALASRSFGGSMSIEYRWKCADGRYKHFLDQAVLLRVNKGRPTEYSGDRKSTRLNSCH